MLEETSKPVVLSDENFDQVLKDAPILLVDFWAVWCRPCQMVAPILEELAEKYKGQIWVGKLNVDENPQIAAKYGATSIPTFWAFKEGKPVGRFVGAYPKPAFVDVFEKLLKIDPNEVENQ